MKKMSRSATRRLLSYHEAGHGVAAHKLGVEVEYITMIASEGNDANVQTRPASWQVGHAGADQAALARSLYADLMVALGGGAAQKLAGYPDNGEREGDSHNVFVYSFFLARIEAGLPMKPAPDEPKELKRGDPLHTAGQAIIDRAWAETITLLQSNWLAVERVAGALRKRDHLTQAELDRVIAYGQRGGETP